jgi:hypothetical protein
MFQDLSICRSVQPGGSKVFQIDEGTRTSCSEKGKSWARTRMETVPFFSTVSKLLAVGSKPLRSRCSVMTIFSPPDCTASCSCSAVVTCVSVAGSGLSVKTCCRPRCASRGVEPMLAALRDVRQVMLLINICKASNCPLSGAEGTIRGHWQPLWGRSALKNSG